MSKHWFTSRIFVTAIGLVVLAAVMVLVVPAQAITWGQPDYRNEFSNVGAIVLDLTDREPLQFCSGTLIAPNVFLTAGHCTALMEELIVAGRLSLETSMVSFDPRDVLQEASWLAIQQIITHPQYNLVTENNDFHDVGLLILAQPVDLPLANLPPQGFLEQFTLNNRQYDGRHRAMFTVVGYGDAIAFPPPETVDNGDGRWYGQSEYRVLLSGWLLMSQNHTREDLEGTCYGDSGGPAFYEDETGKLWLVGITSWGDANCIATGFDYRVDIATTLDFIAPYLAP